jgi:UDP-N-acetyl-2-amino-2-deoxyglucuronate dehydrogenase
MDKERYGVGIIGSGSIASMHIEAFQQLGEQCEIKSISDLELTKAESLSSQYDLKVDIYADYKQMIARADIDVVTICTPPFVREELVVAALAASKHVMCEKPFAASLEECDRMIEAARQHERKLAVMLQTRCETDVQRVRHLVVSGAIGPVLFATAFNHHWRGDTYYRKEWRGTWEKERGGTLMNLGIHTLDIFLWVLGSLESVKAEIGTLGHDIETEDVVTAILKFKSGAIGQFGCTTTFPVSGSSMEFAGKSQMVRYPLSYAAVRENNEGFPIEDSEAVLELTRKAEMIKPVIEGFAGPINDLFAAIKEDREPITGGAMIRQTVEAVTAIYKAATMGTEVKLPIAVNDPWYTTEGLHKLIKKVPRKRDGNIMA